MADHLHDHRSCQTLTPHDYYLWGHMKALMYETKVDSRTVLHRAFWQWQSMYTTIQPKLHQLFSLLMHATKYIATGGGHLNIYYDTGSLVLTIKGTKTHSQLLHKYFSTAGHS